MADMAADEAMTRRALELLGSKRNDAYEAGLAALRKDTQSLWADRLARDPDKLGEDEQPATADVEGLRSIDRCRITPDRGEHRPSAPSASSAPSPKSTAANGFTPPNLRTVANDADGRGDGGAQTVRAKALNHNEEDGADDADANPPPQSTPEKAGASGWRARL